MSKTFPALLISVILIMAIALPACSRPGDRRDSYGHIPSAIIADLSRTIRNAHIYTARKNASLDSLKSIMGHTTDSLEKWETIIKLAAQYRQVNTDSAIFYAKMASGIVPADAPRHLWLKGELSMVNALSTAGLFPSAIVRLDSLVPAANDIESKIEFWKSSRMLYSYMLAFTNSQGEFADLFRTRYLACDDSLLAHLPASDPFYKFIYSERLVTDGRQAEALKNLQALLDQNPPESNIYGMGAYQMAEVYRQKGDFGRFAEYLALSAQSDIMGCVKEGIALPALANWLYEQGDLHDAFNFINFALEEANSGNMRMRTVTIAALIPIIDQSYRRKIDDSRNQMANYLIMSCVLLIVAVVLSAVLLRNIRSTRAKERTLAASSRKLEAYVGNFIGLCANYSARLDQLAKLVVRKINARQTDDLLKLVSSGRFTEEDNEEFYQLIDKAILDIFPDFVERINTLLAPEKRITLPPGESLNPELRIYAFVRLGVDQSSRIAQILHYSVNTVYTYRNRMRNRAINRETFDADVVNFKGPQTLFPEFDPQ